MNPGAAHHRTRSGAGASGHGAALNVKNRPTTMLNRGFPICPSGATATHSLEPKELVFELAALLTDRTPMCTGGDDSLISSANGSVQTKGLGDAATERGKQGDEE